MPGSALAPEGGVGDQLAVALVMRAEGEQLEPVIARLEGAGDAGRDADRVERRDVDDVVVELHPPSAGEDHVDLLRLVVAVGEALPGAGLDAMEGQSRALGLEVAPREPSLLPILVAELRR